MLRVILTVPWLIGITLLITIAMFAVLCFKTDGKLSCVWVTNADLYIPKIGCSKYLFLSLGALLCGFLFIVGAVWKPAAFEYRNMYFATVNQTLFLIGGGFFPVFFFCIGWHVWKCDQFCCSVDESLDGDNESGEQTSFLP